MKYQIKAQTKKYGGKWVVFDETGKVMTEGTVAHCLYWVKRQEAAMAWTEGKVE